MSDVIDAAVTALKAKMDGEQFDGSAKFVIKDEGAIIIDGAGVRAGDDETEVTLTADAETFRAILDGDMNPTTAFMSGKLAVDGDMGTAMRLGSALS
ncbi:SCP-2 sterol transfer family protein [Poseidonocella pacifica]|uniref:SCP-2 sterol transfer family protein n=1 Tax=Poseidonocella pacifica TaxID=871651 RepID=A0A1I0X6E9_9RHOB|nr:SCP2 sterol-binding domain-containing protein [Poseidonocella pacifica]SFA96227.1 SCP-2 sterol transfer family protein [Poseidonocella pacifica]